MSPTRGRTAAAPPELVAIAATLDVEAGDLAFLADLSPEVLARLHGDLGHVLATDDEKVETGLRDAVRALPRPLRGRGAKLIGAQE